MTDELRSQHADWSHAVQNIKLHLHFTIVFVEVLVDFENLLMVDLLVLHLLLPGSHELLLLVAFSKGVGSWLEITPVHGKWIVIL